MLVPFHNGHKVKQQDNTGECEPQCDIAFAARAHRIVIPHDPIAKEDKESAGIPASFSTIRAANKAVI